MKYLQLTEILSTRERSAMAMAMAMSSPPSSPSLHIFFSMNRTRFPPCFRRQSHRAEFQDHDSKPLRKDAGAHNPKIKVQDLWRKDADGHKILGGISFEVKRGEIYGLIGPSGSGKSTVLRALNRLWEPPPSTVFFDGHDITRMDPIGLRTRVGMLFQASYLFQGTVADNVKYGPSLRGIHLSTEEIEDLLLLAGFADIGRNFLGKTVNELSGGEAQRVALARALANNPDVLLLDEPTSSLDPVSTRIVETSLLQLRESKDLTIVIVSHSLEQVGRLVDTASVLYEGSLLETGPFSELKRSDHSVLVEFFGCS